MISMAHPLALANQYAVDQLRDGRRHLYVGFFVRGRDTGHRHRDETGSGGDRVQRSVEFRLTPATRKRRRRSFGSTTDWKGRSG